MRTEFYFNKPGHLNIYADGKVVFLLVIWDWTVIAIISKIAVAPTPPQHKQSGKENEK